MISVKAARYFVFPILLTILLLSCTMQKESPVVLRDDRVERKEKKIDRIKPLRCREDTANNFNASGIMNLPFIRTAFYDVNDDGRLDMITGSKYGSLQMYRNSGDKKVSRWGLIRGYFEGVEVGAFSAPAVGDLDGDGRMEIVVGTGGFSSNSGRIRIFQNFGTKKSPRWKEIQGLDKKIGDDAAVAVVDFNFDKKPDIIAGNSEGKIFFFKNSSRGKKLKFKRDTSFSITKSFHQYAVPAAVKVDDKVILMIGNSLGKLYLFEIRKGKRGVVKKKLKIKTAGGNFLTPSFANLIERNRFDLVLSDGDGGLSYFENKNGNFTVWKNNRQIFNNRILTGPACSPTLTHRKGKVFMVVGNIDGTLRLYEYNKNAEGLPWTERKNYLKGINVSGYSRGVLTTWENKELLITGESSGALRAFINKGTGDKPSWREEKKFFHGIHVNYHSTPSVFDIDGDGRWELITGAQDGRIHAYWMKKIVNGRPIWQEISGFFKDVRVKRFSSPSLVRENNALYLFIGQQDGLIRTYTAALRTDSINFDNPGKIVFHERNYLKNIKMNKHSSPFIMVNSGAFELVSGDYDGNMRHFTCDSG
jgi:hypothetical protein